MINGGCFRVLLQSVNCLERFSSIPSHISTKITNFIVLKRNIVSWSMYIWCLCIIPPTPKDHVVIKKMTIYDEKTRNKIEKSFLRDQSFSSTNSHSNEIIIIDITSFIQGSSVWLPHQISMSKDGALMLKQGYLYW